jgi:GH15 family glucan-1,4-alpha-glucosidase
VADGTAYPSIADHGLIGDLRTAALVSIDGTVDWLCIPRFDGDPVFASLLDRERGGRWALCPTCEVSGTNQFYFPDSNVLVTRFLTVDGVVEVQDFLPVGPPDDEPPRMLIRRVVAVRGAMELRAEVAPRFDHGAAAPSVQDGPDGAVFAHGDVRLRLRATVDLETTDAAASATFSLQEGDVVAFALGLDGTEDGDAWDVERATAAFDATNAFWREWAAGSTYTGRWRETVQRSALTLKLLSHRPTGAIIAAPTTSLPEQIGGDRNWDYRYVWSRDAAFSAYALLRLGFVDEARAFVGWLTDRIAEADGDDDGDSGPLAVLYDLDGSRNLPEREIDSLRGYRGSAPVRIGNGAAGQLQLDIYGEVIDSVYLYNKYGDGVSSATWDHLTRIVEWVCENWDRDDEGIWETRGGRWPHTFSRLMCWVAIERMVRMARQRGLPADLVAWTTARDAIYRQIMDQGFSSERGAFVQHYGSDALDASLLLMPMVKFISPTDPRFLSTLDAICEELVSDSLVYRYDRSISDDEEGTISICSFWYVEALTRAGRLDAARVALEKMFTYANHVGLYAEQIGRTGEQLGNFPQAFTHLALISAAINLDRALGA